MLAGVFTAGITDQIRSANRPPPPPSDPGALIGPNIEFGSGFNLMAGGVFGGLVGLIVGGVVYKTPPPGDKVYHFEYLSDKKKVRILKKLVESGK